MKKNFSLLKFIGVPLLLGPILLSSCDNMLVDEKEDDTDSVLIVPEQAYYNAYFALTNLDGVTSQVGTVRVEKNHRLVEYDYPKYRSENGIYFSGWCLDSSCTIRYNFEKEIISGDISLYGKFIPDLELEVDPGTGDLIVISAGGFKTVKQKDIVIPGIYNGIQRQYSNKRIYEIWKYEYDSDEDKLYASFKDCDFIESVTIGEGVSKIGSNAFNGCEGLKTLSLPNSLEIIEDHAFAYCSNLREVSIPPKIKEIKADCFLHNSRLEKVTFNGTLDIIGKSAFEDCNFKTITVDAEIICDDAFDSNNQLEVINLRSSLKQIDKGSFDGSNKDRVIYNYEGSQEDWNKVIKTILATRKRDKSDTEAIEYFNERIINFNVKMDDEGKEETNENE